MRKLILVLLAGMLISEPAIIFARSLREEARSRDRKNRAKAERIKEEARRIERQGSGNLSRAEQDIRQEKKRAEDDLLPGLRLYCVTYANMKGPSDAAGRAKINWNTIHVRGGRSLAKTRAYGKYGSKNVKKIDNGACSQVYRAR